jgi:hypothetical protein
MLTWLCTFVLLVIALLAMTANATTLVRYLLKGRKASVLPLIGGLAGAATLRAAPVRGVGAWWWVPLIVDYGCVPLLVFYVFRRVWRTRGR